MVISDVCVVWMFGRQHNVNAQIQNLFFFLRGLCGAVGAPPLVLGHRHHLEGRSAGAAGSRPQRGGERKRAWENKDIG